MVLQVLEGAHTLPSSRSKLVVYGCFAGANSLNQNMCRARSEGSPGALIYRKSSYSIYEVDGDEHKA